jgi:hypothetical protein
MRRVAGALVLLTAGAALAVPAAAAPPPPRSADQPAKDGCQRSNGGVLFITSPEWVHVYRNRTPRAIEGLVEEGHPSGEDQPGVHRWYDYVNDVRPDRRYRYLLGGSPSAHTGNFFGGGESGEEERAGLIHNEWESGSLPMFAWPTAGDRIKQWGAWIWDCGHWRAGSANEENTRLTGEKTELHPLQAAVTIRRDGFRSRRGETQADAYISNDGTAAHAVEECALRLQPLSADTYGDQLRACARDRANFVQPLLRSYSFFVPAPPKPSASARLEWREVRRRAGGSDRVRRRANGIDVTASTSRRFGRTYYVGWSQPPRQAPTRLAITLGSLKILKVSDPNPKEPGQRSQPPDELTLYLNANGLWKYVNDWAPGLTAARLHQTFRIGRGVQIEVPAGHPVHLVVRGRECDIPSHSVQFGIFVPRIHPCPPTPNEFSLNEDSPGVADGRFRSAGAALGRHVLRSTGGDGAFAATFSVRKLS